MLAFFVSSRQQTNEDAVTQKNDEDTMILV